MASQWELRTTLPFLSFLYNPKISSQLITWLATCYLIGILLILFDPQDGGDVFLRSFG
jgi:hypothetical protein